jgi:hypothetical protein
MAVSVIRHDLAVTDGLSAASYWSVPSAGPNDAVARVRDALVP